MYFYHTVQPGDTIYSIALKYNVPPCLIIHLNRIRRPNDIRPGMRLMIPVADAEKPQTYPLRPERTGQSVFHYPDPDCSIGQDIVAGTGEMTAASEANADRAPDTLPVLPSGEYRIGEQMKFDRYTVRPGDSVYQIARKYNTTMYHIIIANSLRPPYMIFPGQELIVPFTDDRTAQYTVRPGDTVYSIAAAQGVPPENILQYNYLDADAHIYPGQRLLIRTR